MKKIFFAVMIGCVAMMGVVLSSCNNNNPSKEPNLDAMDPYLVWGASYADVQKHIEAKSYWKDGNKELEFWEGMGWHKWYWVSETQTEQYLFETENGKNLQYVECYEYDESVQRSAVQKYLNDRGYVYLTKRKVGDNETEIYMSADNKTRVYLYPHQEGGWYLYYEPMPSVN